MNNYDIDKLIVVISEEFKVIRKKRKLTLEDVAHDFNLTPSYIGKIENGKHLKLSLFMYMKLADYYDVEFIDVLENAQSKYKMHEKYYDNNLSN